VPKYCYRCSSCDRQDYVFHGMSETLKDCPWCESEGTLVKIPAKFNLAKKDKPEASVGSVVKSSIEEFKKDLKEEKRSIRSEIYEPENN